MNIEKAISAFEQELGISLVLDHTTVIRAFRKGIEALGEEPKNRWENSLDDRPGGAEELFVKGPYRLILWKDKEWTLGYGKNFINQTHSSFCISKAQAWADRIIAVDMLEAMINIIRARIEK